MQERLVLAQLAIYFFGPSQYFEKAAQIEKVTDGVIRPFSMGDFLKFLKVQQALENPQSHMLLINELLLRLVRAQLLEDAGIVGSLPHGRCYVFFKEFTEMQKRSWIWLTPALGPEFLLDQLGASIVHLLGQTPDGDVAGGTGLVVHPHWVLTCAHVLHDAQLDAAQRFSGLQARVRRTLIHPSIDVGLVEVDTDLPVSPGLTFLEPSLLETVYTTGYPPVPRSQAPFLVTQRGEVTTPRMTTYDHRQLFLYSAVARPGNSGGPILSDSGHVVGIVSDSLHHQDQPHTAGFYAGVPTSQLILAIQELAPEIELQVEDYQRDLEHQGGQGFQM